MSALQKKIQSMSECGYYESDIQFVKSILEAIVNSGTVNTTAIILNIVQKREDNLKEENRKAFMALDMATTTLASLSKSLDENKTSRKAKVCMDMFLEDNYAVLAHIFKVYAPKANADGHSEVVKWLFGKLEQMVIDRDNSEKGIDYNWAKDFDLDKYFKTILENDNERS